MIDGAPTPMMIEEIGVEVETGEAKTGTEVGSSTMATAGQAPGGAAGWL